MIVLIILLIILLLSLNLCDDDRVAAFSFATLSLFHEVFLICLPGSWYCMTDAIISGFLITSFSFLNYSEYIKKLMFINIASIALNFIGWYFWLLYLPVDIINACFVAVYLTTAVITYKGNWDGGNTESNCRDTLFSTLVNKIYYYNY